MTRPDQPTHLQDAFGVGVRCVVGEARVLALEGQQEGADLAVAMLDEVDLRDALFAWCSCRRPLRGRSAGSCLHPVRWLRIRADPTSPASCRSRCSTPRFSCDSAITGTCSSLASALSEREISAISVARFSLRARHLHQLQVVDHDQTRGHARASRAARGRAARSASAPGVSSMKILRFRELAGGAGDAHPVLVGDAAAAQLLSGTPPMRGEHARDAAARRAFPC